MSGSQAPHLQRRNGIYHLRLRVPDDLKLRMGMVEVRRSLRTYKLAEARTLVATYAARVRSVFEMVRQHELTKADVRSLLSACFRELEAEADHGIVVETDNPDAELAEQRLLANERLSSLRQAVASENYNGLIWASAEAALSGRAKLEALAPSLQSDLLAGVARALIEQQRLFLHRLDDRIAPYHPADALFDHVTASSIPNSERRRSPIAVVGPIGNRTPPANLRAQASVMSSADTSLHTRRSGHRRPTPLASVTSVSWRSSSDRIGRYRT